MLFRGTRAHEVERRFDTFAQIERRRLDVHAARLDLREVEDVVDDREECVAGIADRVDVVALLAVERRVEQQPRESDDRVHRRADLMAHGGEERALRLVGLFRSRARFVGLGKQPRVLDGDPDVGRDRAEQVLVGVAEASFLARALHADGADRFAARHDRNPQVRLGRGSHPCHADRAGSRVQRFVDDQRLGRRDDLARPPLADRLRTYVVAIHVREANEARLLVHERDVDDVRAEGLAHLLADELDQRLQLELRGDRLPDGIDRGQLGGALRRLLEQDLGLLEQARVLQRDAHAARERGEQPHVGIAEGVFAIDIVQADDAAHLGADEDRDAYGAFGGLGSGNRLARDADRRHAFLVIFIDYQWLPGADDVLADRRNRSIRYFEALTLFQQVVVVPHVGFRIV